MSSLSHIEKRRFERMLGMASGYVLDFTDRTFSEFFRDVANIGIDNEKYFAQGGSKAKRLRCFWEIESDPIVGKVLEQMLVIWSEQHPDKTDLASGSDYDSALGTVARLLGKQQDARVSTEADFLKIDFSKAAISKLPVEPSLAPILEARFKETTACLAAGASLAAVILTGSLLEGLLLAHALADPKRFNQAAASPKDAFGKVRLFHDWTLANLIDVACEVGLLKLDVKKFGHSLRDFRNYIHPYEQRISGFVPDQHTARICLQVLRAAMADLCGER